MGRFLVYSLIFVLSVFILTAALVLQRGGGASGAAVDVSVHDLIAGGARYQGGRVTTRGVLRQVPDSEERYALEDEGVRVTVAFSTAILRAYKDESVAVEGRYESGEIRAESVVPAQ